LIILGLKTDYNNKNLRFHQLVVAIRRLLNKSIFNIRLIYDSNTCFTSPGDRIQVSDLWFLIPDS
jgi:hypothetical protein